MREHFDKLFGALLRMLLNFIYGNFVWGMVIWCFWGWFLQQVFTNVQDITLVDAIGLSIFITVIRHGQVPLKKEFYEPLGKALPYIAPWFLIGMGWIVHLLLF